MPWRSLACRYGALNFVLLLLAGCPALAEAQQVKYGADALVPSQGGRGGWALRLGSGQIVVPINRAFLELVLADPGARLPPPSPNDRYPTAGRGRARLTRFTETGAVLEMGEGSGLYVMERDGTSGYVTFADDPRFMSVDATAALKDESRKRLDDLTR